MDTRSNAIPIAILIDRVSALCRQGVLTPLPGRSDQAALRKALPARGRGVIAQAAVPDL